MAIKSVIIIPSRLNSYRLPGKALLKETGKYLIQHVWERAIKSKADKVIVATDDHKIHEVITDIGGKAYMTDKHHVSGTDRIAEVVKYINCDIVINLQGDEPMISHHDLDLLIDIMEENKDIEMATLATPLKTKKELFNKNCVKVVIDKLSNALYFSRSPIPHSRNGYPFVRNIFLKHIGIYSYTREFLLEFTSKPSGLLETVEDLEQLRALELGTKIKVEIVEETFGGIDTREDYDRFVALTKPL